MVEQVVVLGDEKKIQIQQVEEAGDQPHGVDAGAETANRAAAAQFLQRPPAAGGQFDLERCHPFGGMKQQVEVVDHQEFDGAEAQALQAVLVGTHDAVVAVVEVQRERERLLPELLAQRVRSTVGRSTRPTLVDELVAPQPAQEFAEAVLALAVAVEG